MQSFIEDQDGVFASLAPLIIPDYSMVVSKGVNGLNGNLNLSA